MLSVAFEGILLEEYLPYLVRKEPLVDPLVMDIASLVTEVTEKNLL
jgi:hypothetical protein